MLPFSAPCCYYSISAVGSVLFLLPSGLLFLQDRTSTENLFAALYNQSGLFPLAGRVCLFIFPSAVQAENHPPEEMELGPASAGSDFHVWAMAARAPTVGMAVNCCCCMSTKNASLHPRKHLHGSRVYTERIFDDPLVIYPWILLIRLFWSPNSAPPAAGGQHWHYSPPQDWNASIGFLCGGRKP